MSNCRIKPRRRIIQIGQQFGRKTHSAHEGLLAQDLPGGGRTGQLPEQPVKLGLSEQRLRLLVRLQSLNVNFILPNKIIPVVKLLVPRHEPGLEHVKSHQVSERKTAVGSFAALGVLANRHPLVIGLQGGRFPHFEIAFPVVVIGRAVFVGVIGEFVIVPDRYERMRRVNGPKLGIQAVNRVTSSVVIKGYGLDVVIRRQIPHHFSRIIKRQTLRIVLVDIVPQVQNGIHVSLLRGVAVDVEIAGGIISA